MWPVLSHTHTHTQSQFDEIQNNIKNKHRNFVGIN